MRFTFDSNVLVYAADDLAGSRQQQARDLVARATRVDCILTLQCLGEFFHVVTRKVGVATAEAARIASSWRAVFPIHAADEHAFDRALDAVQRYRLQFWDAMIWAVAEQAHCRFLLSEDLQNGQTIGRVTILDPFNPANAGTIASLMPSSG